MFHSDDLFSFLLKLPVIFSTNDTDTIVSGFQLAKGGREVMYEDFRRIISVGQCRLSENWSYIETECYDTHDKRVSGRASAFVDTNEPFGNEERVASVNSVVQSGQDMSNSGNPSSVSPVQSKEIERVLGMTRPLSIYQNSSEGEPMV